MRRRFRYDADLDCLVEIGGNSNYFEEEKPRTPNVISDDLGFGVNGLKHLPSNTMLDSKSAHYKENKRRGLEHVGGEENFASKREKPHPDHYMREVLKADQQIQGNWNGTADWLQRQKEQERR